MLSRRVKRALLLLLAVGFGILAVAPAGQPAARAGGMQAAAQAQAAPAGIQAKGYLEPARWVNLSFPVAGQILEINVREGATVDEEEVLARQGDLRKYQNRQASAELELLLAQQAYTSLQDRARLELAQAEQRLAEARKVEDRAIWKVYSIQQPASFLSIAQARANLLLKEKGMRAAQKDLQDAERQWQDRQDILWRFVPRRLFRLNLTLLRQKAAQAEDRYQDAADKLDDLLEPPDEIDVQVAEGDLASAQAEVGQALRLRAAWGHGPDPDQVALTQARIQAAQQAVLAANAALRDQQLSAPFAGVVASLPAKAGEWVGFGQPVLVLADLSSWKVQVDDLKEEDVTAWRVGQTVNVIFDALPDLQMQAVVEAIDWIYHEEDGDPTYTVTLALLGVDPRLRWGMTARLAL